MKSPIFALFAAKANDNVRMRYMSTSQHVHLGHVISSDLDDARDIDGCPLAPIRQINKTLCYLGTGKLNPVITSTQASHQDVHDYGCKKLLLLDNISTNTNNEWFVKCNVCVCIGDTDTVLLLRLKFALASALWKQA